MDGDGFNGNGAQGIEDDNGSNGSESGSVTPMNNFAQGSSAPLDDDEMTQGSQPARYLPDGNDRTDSSLINDGDNGSPAQSPEDSVVSDSCSTNLTIPPFKVQRASDLLMAVSLCADLTKTKITDLAHSAMDELFRVGTAGKPLWTPQKYQRWETMNDIEYLREFGEIEETLRGIMKMVEVGETRSLPNFYSGKIECDPTLVPTATPKQDLRIEASRDMESIQMNPIKLVELLMDLNQWSRTFYNLVSRVALLGTLSTGVEGSREGQLQVVKSSVLSVLISTMIAEFHLPTPFVATWECYFARYCKKLSADMWGVVDVSLEKFFPYPSTSFRRRPSGCLIKEKPNGYSEVIWIEHLEADYSQLNINFKPLISTGFALSATRWLASLVRSCEFSEALKARTAPTHNGCGRSSLLHLAERIMRIFFADISASTANQWMPLVSSFSGSNNLRMMVKNSTEGSGKPRGTAVIFATSVWLPVPPKRVFNFLRDDTFRNEWDMLSRGCSIRELSYVIKGKDPRNRVSIMQAKTSYNQFGSFYIQESYTDPTGSYYVVYAPVDSLPLSYVLDGGNPDNVPILPSGFAILPDGISGNYDDEANSRFTGSLITIAFQIIIEKVANMPFIPSQLVDAFNNIITSTLMAIKDAGLNDH